MLTWLREQGVASERKARLFSVAVCRKLWPRLTDERSRRAVEVAEQFAEGLVGTDAVRAANDAVRDVLRDPRAPRAVVAVACVVSVAPVPGCPVGQVPVVRAMHCADWASQAGRGLAPPDVQAALLRDLIHPFHTAPFDPAWRASAVLALAQAAYDERQFDRLPILADALEDAGCTDAELLRHLRSETGHVRGCWALDAVLGRA
jgi:hypothetical protein